MFDDLDKKNWREEEKKQGLKELAFSWINNRNIIIRRRVIDFMIILLKNLIKRRVNIKK